MALLASASLIACATSYAGEATAERVRSSTTQSTGSRGVRELLVSERVSQALSNDPTRGEVKRALIQAGGKRVHVSDPQVGTTAQAGGARDLPHNTFKVKSMWADYTLVRRRSAVQANVLPLSLRGLSAPSRIIVSLGASHASLFA